MQLSKVKEKLGKGEQVTAIKLVYQDPALYEMAGKCGFDCTWICNEHIGIDASKMDSLIRACRASNIDAMVRTKPGDYRDLLHPLEMGAKGIMLPRVQHPDEVRQVVKDMKFYPLGRRGADGVNADADFGLLPLDDYLKMANENTFLVAQIEDPEAIEHIDEIASIEGVDIVFIGRGDLSINLGVAGDMKHSEIIQACKSAADSCRKYGKAAGTSCSSFDDAKLFKNMGFNFLCYGSDYIIMRQGFERLLKEHEELSVKIFSE
jgi:4-hydroxy-2-oxoheptanedioate aldolase